jgi:hypothetical protein
VHGFTEGELEWARQFVRDERRRNWIREQARNPRNREAGAQPAESRRPRDTSPGAEAREAGLRALETMEVDATSGDRRDYLAAATAPALTVATSPRSPSRRTSPRSGSG